LVLVLNDDRSNLTMLTVTCEEGVFENDRVGVMSVSSALIMSSSVLSLTEIESDNLIIFVENYQSFKPLSPGYLKPLRRHFKNGRKWPPFCEPPHTAKLLHCPQHNKQ